MIDDEWSEMQVFVSPEVARLAPFHHAHHT
jgi:hypothetical protein